MWPQTIDKLGEVDRHLVDVGDRPAGLRRAQRAGVADLGAERHAELDAGGVQRVVATVGRRRLPQPRHDAQPLEAELGRRSGAARARPASGGRGRRRRAPAKRSGCSATQAATSSLEISAPSCGACQALSSPTLDAGLVHRRDRRRRSGSSSSGTSRRSSDAASANISWSQEAARRMLHPGVDGHGAPAVDPGATARWRRRRRRARSARTVRLRRRVGQASG